MGNVSQTIEDIAHDLYTIGLSENSDYLRYNNKSELG